MEMERMMGCQIPAFGVWNYCTELPITQYFDIAMQARLLKRGSRRRDGEKEDAHGSGQRLVVPFNAYPSARCRPAQIKVIRREVGKQCNGGELHDGSTREEVAYTGGGAYAKKRVVARAVDEDLYKVPQPMPYHKPRKVRKVVWSLWIGCLGLDCIA